MEGQNAIAFYVAMPVIFSIALLTGLVRRDRGFIFAGLVCLGGWGIAVLGQSGNVSAIVNWAEPLWIKIILGVLCSVVGGLIIRAFFRKTD
ncbi:MAG TPA: hypothetical protein VMZ92_20955 [Planctomycetota bacterium]|nr:hypothetical protein [Planctomycetota bacterium]